MNERNLADRYTRLNEAGSDGRTLIFHDSTTSFGLSGSVRQCWIEGQDMIPDSCFAPEPKPQEFRKGDWVAGKSDTSPYYQGLQYFRVVHVNPTVPIMSVEDARGGRYYCKRSDLILIQHSPTPKGPPVVGSYVGGKTSGRRGIVKSVRAHPRRPYGINWNDGSGNWYMADELIHIASPKEIT